MSDCLISQIGTILKDKCASYNSECESGIETDLTNANYDLQSRQVGLVLALGGYLLASYVYMIIELHKVDKPVPQILNLAADEYSSMTAVKSATKAVLQTASADAGMDTPVTDIAPGLTSGPIISTGTLTTGVVLTTATDTANGNKPARGVNV